jgi:hypothetical protein
MQDDVHGDQTENIDTDPPEASLAMPHMEGVCRELDLSEDLTYALRRSKDATMLLRRRCKRMPRRH